MTSQEEEAIRPFEWLTSPSSLRDLLSTVPDGNKRALHVGSGSSTVGELLVEELSYYQVFDVDKDGETVDRMRKRWLRRCEQTDVDASRLQHVTVDFTKSKIEVAEDASFTLVLDKSTLDCTLCSDNATAALLVEVYRCLAAGGVYVLISFHEKDLLLPLLQDLPGAEWQIKCLTMARQVERLDTSISISRPCAPVEELGRNASAVYNASTNHPPLNVLLAQKTATSGNHELSVEKVRDHVHSVNDAWFQQSHPLLTRQRQQQLQSSFSVPLSLSQAYEQLFTEAEREHLTYEYFLEDWEAFLDQWKSKNAPGDYANGNPSLISFEMALEFLNEMQ